MRIASVSFAALAAVLLAAPGHAHADRRFAVQGAIGSGAMVGGSADAIVALRSPTFFDLGVATWSDDDPVWWLGGGLRAEFESRASIAVTARLGLAAHEGPLTVRPYFGAAWFFAPFALFGPELGVDVAFEVLGALSIFARGYVDAFFTGSDVPQDSAVVMFNGAAGVEVVF